MSSGVSRVRNGDRGREASRKDRISGMVGMGRLPDGPLFTFAVFPERGPHEQYSKDEYGSGRKMTDGGVEVAVDPVECELSDQYRQADHEDEV